MAGRVAYHELRGLGPEEVPPEDAVRLWLRGGYPRSFLAKSDAASAEWRRELVRTFLESDVPQLGISVAARALRRFWTMLAHRHGDLWNASELARSLGVADSTVRRYLDLLCATFVARELPAWRQEGLTKRQVRAPRVFLADTGLLHTLLNLEERLDVERHPKFGESWGSFALDSLDVVHPARDTFPMGEGIRAVALSRIGADLSPL